VGMNISFLRNFELSRSCSWGLCSGMYRYITVWLVSKVFFWNSLVVLSSWVGCRTFGIEDETSRCLKTFGYQSPGDATPHPRKNRNIKKLVYFERGAELGNIW